MPREFALFQIDHNIGEAFQVVTPALLLQQMWVETREANSPQEVFLLPIFNVFSCLQISVVVAKAEVNQVDLLTLLSEVIFSPHLITFACCLPLLGHSFEDKVFRLDVSMDDALIMNLFKSRQLLYKSEKMWVWCSTQPYHLVHYHYDGHHREILALAFLHKHCL